MAIPLLVEGRVVGEMRSCANKRFIVEIQINWVIVHWHDGVEERVVGGIDVGIDVGQVWISPEVAAVVGVIVVVDGR